MKKTIFLFLLIFTACARPIDPADVSLDVEPVVIEQNTPAQWIFTEDGQEYLEEMLLKPVRQAYGMQDPDKAFSRCSSSVSHSLYTEDEPVVFEEGFYYGTLYIYMGCETGEEYPFRVFMDGSTVQVENEAGEYVSVQEWLE